MFARTIRCACGIRGTLRSTYATSGIRAWTLKEIMESLENLHVLSATCLASAKKFLMVTLMVSTRKKIAR